MVKIRGYKTIITLMLIILLTSCFLTISINAFNHFQDKKDDSSSGYLDRLTYTITDSVDDLITNYQNYGYFKIKDDGGYKTFCEFINEYQYIGSNNGTNLISNDYFANKTVFLATDITGMTYRANQFSGLFDGCGFTLSEFDIECDSDNFTGGILFNTLNTNGTIENVKMFANRATISGGSASGGDKVLFGGIVGTNNGTIQECIVSTVRFNSDRYADVLFVAPIAGKNNGTITNCFVNGTYYLRGKDKNFLAGSDGMHAYYFRVEGNDPTNSVYQATVIEEEITERIYAPNENGEKDIRAGADTLGDSNYDSTQTAQTSMSNMVLSNTAGLASDTPWFNYGAFSYNAEGNYFIYLRVFIEWTSFYFDRDGDGTYDQEVLAPIDCKSQIIQYIGNNLSTHSISIFDNTIYPNITGYNFDGWEKVDDLHYKVTKSIQTFNVSFYPCDNSTIKVGNVEVSGEQSYVVNYNTKISVHLTHLGKFGAYYSTITFSFTDSSDNNVEVKYEPNTLYYFKGYNIGSGTQDTTSITITSTTTFNLTAILKTYTPEYE